MPLNRNHDELVRPGDFVTPPGGPRWVVGFVIPTGVYPALDAGRRPGRHLMLFREVKSAAGVEILQTLRPETSLKQREVTHIDFEPGLIVDHGGRALYLHSEDELYLAVPPVRAALPYGHMVGGLHLVKAHDDLARLLVTVSYDAADDSVQFLTMMRWQFSMLADRHKLNRSTHLDFNTLPIRPARPEEF